MKVLVVDDDSLVAMSLKTIIESDPDLSVAGLGKCGEDAIRLFDETEPDVLLMDIRMNGMTGLEAGEEIIKKHPNAKILFLTTFNDDEYIIKALAIGAKGYIIKQDFESIIPSIKAVYGGQTVFGSDIMERIPDILSGKKQSDYAVSNAEFKDGEGAFDYESAGLTSQEAEVVECVARGLSNKEIADTLFLSEGTVRNYLSNILHKLELRDRTNLAIYYYKNLK